MHSTLLLTTLLPLVSAHFGIEYPEWRGDSFTTPGSSQWTYPCAGVNTSDSSPRTPWPLTGGSLALELHHPWTYMFVNLGLGSVAANFNISLTPALNETGNGTFCWKELQGVDYAAFGVEEGTEASLQVITVNERGAALYNCADIVFTSNATLAGDDVCFNSTGLSATALTTEEANASSTESGSSSASSSAASAGNSLGVSSGLVAGLLALGAAFAL